MNDKIDLTQEQLDAICEYSEYKRNSYKTLGKQDFLRDVRHEIIDLVMIETATSKPNEVKVAAYREVLDIMEKLLDKELFVEI